MAEIAQSVVATRLAIFEQEFTAKAVLLGKGLAAVTVAAALGVVALLLLAALLAALFSQLFHNVVLGILVAMRALCRGPPPAPAYFAWKSLAGIRPPEFPATSRELARDCRGDSRGARAGPRPGRRGPIPTCRTTAVPNRTESSEIEERLRAGAE